MSITLWIKLVMKWLTLSLSPWEVIMKCNMTKPQQKFLTHQTKDLKKQTTQEFQLLQIIRYLKNIVYSNTTFKLNSKYCLIQYPCNRRTDQGKKWSKSVWSDPSGFQSWFILVIREWRDKYFFFPKIERRISSAERLGWLVFASNLTKQMVYAETGFWHMPTYHNNLIGWSNHENQ